jgi:hypothetical protein
MPAAFVCRDPYLDPCFGVRGIDSRPIGRHISHSKLQNRNGARATAELCLMWLAAICRSSVAGWLDRDLMELRLSATSHSGAGMIGMRHF